MESLKITSLFQTDTFHPWELRKNTVKKSHYDTGDRTEAMVVLYSCRKEIQDSIFEMCDNIQKDYNPQTEHFIETDIWNKIVSEHLVTKFLEDHIGSRIFTKRKLQKYYPNSLNFFGDLTSLFGDISYSNNLKKLSNRHIEEDDVQKGWAVMIREYGLFAVNSKRLGWICNNILCNLTPYLSSLELKNNIEKNMPEALFTSKIFENITCPAGSVVRNHISVCLATNVALIKAGVYTPENRINFLNDNEGSHFRKKEDVYEEYENKIAHLTN